ncbi:Protein kinase DC2 [Eumeta japonica]|uniref:Protein kinase DC2 n=1 Tax=Eumeta variegata TaxID=151549 RepID=A0A4C1VPR2_EUMVA|nr:Protein kinase DC2 [Eumeta japonica]
MAPAIGSYRRPRHGRPPPSAAALVARRHMKTVYFCGLFRVVTPRRAKNPLARVLIYEMLVGYPPFYDDNPFGIYEKILNGRVEWPRHLDPVAKDIIKKLLVQDRTKRLGNMKSEELVPSDIPFWCHVQRDRARPSAYGRVVMLLR